MSFGLVSVAKASWRNGMGVYLVVANSTLHGVYPIDVQRFALLASLEVKDVSHSPALCNDSFLVLDLSQCC